MSTELDPRAAGGKRLKGKICVVTGAGQGIGRATARRLGAEGGTVVVADRNDKGATEAVAELQKAGVEALKVVVDLGSLDGAKEMMSKAVDAYGRIDVLVNNVGGTIWIKPFHLYTEEEVTLVWKEPFELVAHRLDEGVHGQHRYADIERGKRLEPPQQLADGLAVGPQPFRIVQGLRHDHIGQGR